MSTTEQGALLNRYKVIPRTLIFITRGEYVLLLKGAPTKRLWANKWNGVGGHIESGEDVLSSAIRELFEETGISTPLWLCGTIMIDTKENTGICLFVFKGEYTSGELHPSQEGLLEWVKITDLDLFPLLEDLKIILPRILQTTEGNIPFSWSYRYSDTNEIIVMFEENCLPRCQKVPHP